MEESPHPWEPAKGPAAAITAVAVSPLRAVPRIPQTGEARLHRFGALFVCLALIFGPAPTQGEEPAKVWRGNFTAGARGLLMSPCRSGERVALEDRTPGRELETVYRELAQRPGRAIFMEIFGRREGASLRAESLRRAYAEGPGCREDLGPVRLRAHGTDPLWHVDARADGVLFRRLRAQEVRRFPPAPLERRGTEYRYEGAAETSVLRFAVREERCRDALSGALYTLRVIAELDELKLTGCGYWGDLDLRR